MKKYKIHSRQSNAARALSLLWIFLTALLLALILHHQWHKYLIENNKLLQIRVDQINLRFTAWIDSFRHEISSLPLYGRDLKDCKNDLLPILESMNTKNPNILGSVISENSKIICSTFGTKYRLPQPNLESLSLYGPMWIGPYNHHAFLLQQRLGQYYLGIYILKSAFADLLKSSLLGNEFIALYNIKKHINLLVVGDTNLIVTLGSIQAAETVKTAISNIPNHGISITRQPLSPNPAFFYHELPLILVISLFSYLLYRKFRSILHNRFSLHYALTHALKHKHFQPAYQPIKDNTLNQFTGAEVLLRWQTDSNEIIMPDAFITDAEESGLIIPITLQLIEKTFIQSKLLLKTHPDFHLAFNLSAIHFTDNDFLNDFYELCSDQDVPAKQVMIELTERQLLDQGDERLVNKMKDLRLRGYSLAIDDFGTGHASIKYLQHFPFNYLKIDQIFIKAIGTGAITETLNHAIIQLARSLELNIIAEGVETVEQLDFLLKSEVNFVQGWYFAKAMSLEELTKFIEHPS
ncbi:MAG: EAL domain-containing protein [Tatlockia sp.]|nr:EAL domain-containing protein [Tatlockia sp.]